MKENLSEKEAASLFVSTVFIQAKEQWPYLANGIKQLDEGDSIGFDREDQQTFVWALATIALDLRALDNLLPAAQATRLRNLTMLTLSVDDSGIGEVARSGIEELKTAFDSLIEHGPDAIPLIGKVLYKHLGGRLEPNPILCSFLGSSLIGGKWKAILNQYRVTP